MENTPSIPPLASPHGEEAREPSPEVTREFGPNVSVPTSLESAFRASCFSFCNPLVVLTLGAVTAVITLILYPVSWMLMSLVQTVMLFFVSVWVLLVPLLTLLNLLFWRKFEAEVKPDGVWKGIQTATDSSCEQVRLDSRTQWRFMVGLIHRWLFHSARIIRVARASTNICAFRSPTSSNRRRRVAAHIRPSRRR